MALFSYDRFAREALLICDECDHFFARGARSAAPARASEPHELSAFFELREDLIPSAEAAGWKVTRLDGPRALWRCPDCAASGRE